jgi:hypothetical protein
MKVRRESEGNDQAQADARPDPGVGCGRCEGDYTEAQSAAGSGHAPGFTRSGKLRVGQANFAACFGGSCTRA